MKRHLRLVVGNTKTEAEREHDEFHGPGIDRHNDCGFCTRDHMTPIVDKMVREGKLVRG